MAKKAFPCGHRGKGQTCRRCIAANYKLDNYEKLEEFYEGARLLAKDDILPDFETFIRGAGTVDQPGLLALAAVLGARWNNRIQARFQDLVDEHDRMRKRMEQDRREAAAHYAALRGTEEDFL